MHVPPPTQGEVNGDSNGQDMPKCISSEDIRWLAVVGSTDFVIVPVDWMSLEH